MRNGLGQRIHIGPSDISIACHKMALFIHFYDYSQDHHLH